VWYWVLRVKCALSVEWRKASEVFAKVLADGTIGLFVDFRLSAVRQVKFFAELFYKKAGFWLLFSKSNINY